MQNFPPRRELDLARSLELFMVMAEDHRRELGLSRTELEALAAASEEFEDALAHQTMLQTMLSAAIKRKRSTRKRLEDCLRPVKKGMRQHLTEAKDLLAEVGLRPDCPERRRHVRLGTPTDVKAQRTSIASVDISWSAAGNRTGITFIVECSYGSEEWHLVGATTRRHFVHDTMGDIPTGYRVIAAHKGRSSEPSEGSPVRSLLRVA